MSTIRKTQPSLIKEPVFVSLIQRASTIKVFPGDETFTTRLRNVEWGHDAVLKMDVTPRMKPDAVTYPIGTRMNWVTWEPILPEDNFLETPDYGNGPGKAIPVLSGDQDDQEF